MKMKKQIKYTYILMMLLVSFSVYSQDLHFSQYYMSPLTLNPAMTGLFNGNYRFTGNYRNQWQSVLPTVPFRTFAGSVDLSAKSGTYNRVGGGVHLFSDQAGSLNLARTQVAGSVSYLLALSRNRDYFIAAGIQAAMNQSSFNYLNMTTGNQWTGNAFDANASTGEIFDGRSKSFASANLGIMWYHISNVRSFQYIGGSIHHINRPNISLVPNSVDRLYTKYSVHAGAGFKVKPRFDLNPYMLTLIQGPSFELTSGILGKFILDERKNSAFGGTAFYIGPFLRIVGDDETNLSSDALIISTKLDIDSFTFGLSYDINVSGLSPASSGRGGPEIALQYVGAFKSKPSKTFCPKF
ncbi:MAG: PorP/SprF family type IX secretion system membrane protein [Bacteroidota bacterium]|jgi:type IX secretion system PorP/SprF family membrane protein|nr:PorP/SprF family type IX secretion system membrane protein [Bacteroidota bacterium]GDX47494.1 hypothetical protein LBMAG25_03120 [Bacteroidota bacterium]